MLFRVHIAIIKAVENAFWKTIPKAERDTYDSVACTFGINADSIEDAVQIAVTAASNAVDRNGAFIGGIPIEVNCRCVDRDQFAGYEEYFHNPITARGVFYVSGTTTYNIQKALAADVSERLAELKLHVDKFGLPKSSFVHPPLPPEPPTRIRLLCTDCEHWVEVSNVGLMFSFLEGLDCFGLENSEFRRENSVAGAFMRKHLDKCKAGIIAVHEDNPRWACLDENNRDSLPS